MPGKNPSKIQVLPLPEMALRLQTGLVSGKPCIEIRYAHQNGFYRSIPVYAEDIPPRGLQFSDIEKLAAKKEEEFESLRKAQK